MPAAMSQAVFTSLSRPCEPHSIGALASDLERLGLKYGLGTLRKKRQASQAQ